MSKVIIYVLLALAMLLTWGPGTSHSQAAPNVLFILDASGSMAQKFGDRTKMQAAKDVFRSLVADLPKDANVGLEVYGHYGDKDCSAIEVVNPVAPLDAWAIKANVDKLIPRQGATPLAASLEKGGEAFRSVKGEKTIVLISDGRETCGGSPAAVAKRLRAQGVNITIHVVGLGVNDEEKAQLASIASAGGGRYYAANNAEELKESLSEIQQKVVEKAPKVIFKEDFNDEFLSDVWEVKNDNPDGRVIDDGKLQIITMPGGLEKEKTQNLIAYDKEIPAKNWDAIVKVSIPITSYGRRNSQGAGLALIQDKDNFLLLVVTSSWSAHWGGDYILARFWNRRSGQWVPELNHGISKPNTRPVTYYLKIEKRGFKYTAYYSLDEKKWAKVGTHAALGKHFKPALWAERWGSSTETIAEFDWFTLIDRD